MGMALIADASVKLGVLTAGDRDRIVNVLKNLGFDLTLPVDVKRLLKEVDKMLQLNVDDRPLICGVGLGGYWAERIGFLCDIRQVVFNPNLFPNENMEGKIDRPEEYVDIATKCVSNFREKNRDRCLVILSRNDEALNSHRAAELLHHYYEIVWDEEQTHKFKNISPHLQRIKAFKTLG